MSQGQQTIPPPLPPLRTRCLSLCPTSHSPSPPPPEKKPICVGFCLVVDSAGKNFLSKSLWILQTVVPPCEFKEESGRAVDMVSTAACVWEEVAWEALGGFHEQFSKALRWYTYFSKKRRPNFFKWWLFFSQSQYTHSFWVWSGSFSLVTTSFRTQF